MNNEDKAIEVILGELREALAEAPAMDTHRGQEMMVAIAATLPIEARVYVGVAVQRLFLAELKEALKGLSGKSFSAPGSNQFSERLSAQEREGADMVLEEIEWVLKRRAASWSIDRVAALVEAVYGVASIPGWVQLGLEALCLVNARVGAGGDLERMRLSSPPSGSH